MSNNTQPSFYPPRNPAGSPSSELLLSMLQHADWLSCGPGKPRLAPEQVCWPAGSSRLKLSPNRPMDLSLDPFGHLRSGDHRAPQSSGSAAKIDTCEVGCSCVCSVPDDSGLVLTIAVFHFDVPPQLVEARLHVLGELGPHGLGRRLPVAPAYVRQPLQDERAAATPSLTGARRAAIIADPRSGFGLLAPLSEPFA